MTAGEAKWYSEFLEADERAIITFESTKEPGVTEIAVAGAFGLVGGAIGAAAGSAVAQTMSPSAYQKAPGEWDGRVVLTKRRLLLIDGHGVARSVDRAQVQSVELSGSKAGAWSSRIDVETDAGICRLHTPLKIAHVLAQHFSHQGGVRVNTNEGSPLDILKAIPVIVLFFIAAITIAVGLGAGNWLAVILGTFVLAGAEMLRRLLFPRQKKQEKPAVTKTTPQPWEKATG